MSVADDHWPVNRMPCPYTTRIAPRPLSLLLCLIWAAAALLTGSRAPAVGPLDLPRTSARPMGVAFTPSGQTVFVALSDLDEITELDAVTGEVRRRLPSGGQEPWGMALSRDGEWLAVSHRLGGSVALFRSEADEPATLISLPGEPRGLVFSRDGRRLFVALSLRDEVAVVQTDSGRLLARWPAPQRPKAIVLSPDGATLLVAGSQSGVIRRIDTRTGKEIDRIATEAVNLRGLAISGDGKTAWATGMIPHAYRALTGPYDPWENVAMRIDLATRRIQTIKLDTDLGAADPEGVATNHTGTVAYVALGGADRVVRISGRNVLWSRPLDANPRYLALSPDGSRLWVTHRIQGTTTVLETDTLRRVRVVDLPRPRKRERRLFGEYLFVNNERTKGGRVTCNSCHPDGDPDGQTWRFTHVEDGLDVRNSRALRGDFLGTSPFRWRGTTMDVEVFINEEYEALFGAAKQPHSILHPLWNYLDQFPLPQNPWRAPDGTLTEAAKRGETLFHGKAGCASCHSGEDLGGTVKKAWVGTTSGDLPLDVPHLRGAYASAPYLHDGSAMTLADVFKRKSAENHGRTTRLTPGELSDVLEFVRQQ